MKKLEISNVIKIAGLVIGALAVGHLLVQPTPLVKNVELTPPAEEYPLVDGDSFSLRQMEGQAYLLYVWDFG